MAEQNNPETDQQWNRVNTRYWDKLNKKQFFERRMPRSILIVLVLSESKQQFKNIQMQQASFLILFDNISKYSE